MDSEKSSSLPSNEPYVTVVHTILSKPDGCKVDRYEYTIFPTAIKDAILEWLNSEYRPVGQITNYYIELDRNENLMKAVIELK